MNSDQLPPPKRLVSNATPPPPFIHNDCPDPNFHCIGQRRTELCQFVFDVELLREHILEYAILDEAGHLSLKFAASYRQVQMSWLESVTKLCHKSEKPLFSFRIGGDRQNDKDNWGTYFSQFVDMYATPLRLLARVPPFSLALHWHSVEMSTPETQSKVNKCLQECNCGLINLSLNICATCESSHYPEAITQLSLPHLISFHIHAKSGFGTSVANYLSNAAVSIQSILAGSPQLKLFKVKGSPHIETFLPGFQSLRLPTSLVEVKINWNIAHTVMERLLTVNVLPQLQHLSVHVQGHFYDTGTLRNITNKLRSMLTKLTVSGVDYNLYDRENFLQLPLMESLRCLHFSSGSYQWPEGIFELEKTFPKLEDLKLDRQPVKMLRRWMERSRFENMKRFDVTFPRYDSDFNLNIEMVALELVTLINQAFPNLTHLTMTLRNTEDISPAMQYIFRNMEKLEFIYLCLEQSGTHCVHPLFWDSVLRGVPLDALREVQIYGILINLEKAEKMLQGKDNMESSIINLTQLKRLSLMSPTYAKSCFPISDKVFQSTFLRMDNLYELTFMDSVQVSEEMKSKWKEAGRKICQKY